MPLTLYRQVQDHPKRTRGDKVLLGLSQSLADDPNLFISLPYRTRTTIMFHFRTDVDKMAAYEQTVQIFDEITAVSSSLSVKRAD